MRRMGSRTHDDLTLLQLLERPINEFFLETHKHSTVLSYLLQSFDHFVEAVETLEPNHQLSRYLHGNSQLVKGVGRRSKEHVFHATCVGAVVTSGYPCGMKDVPLNSVNSADVSRDLKCNGLAKKVQNVEDDVVDFLGCVLTSPVSNGIFDESAGRKVKLSVEEVEHGRKLIRTCHPPALAAIVIEEAFPDQREESSDLF